jgi:hypothetical protein
VCVWGEGPCPLRWSFNREFFGWTANQWQAWARGELEVTAEQATQAWAVRCANVGEFWIDDERYHGDWYGYGERWSRVVLAAGRHRVRVRLASEVRLFGGALPPSLTFVMEVRALPAPVLALDGGRIVPELVDGRLVSSPISVALFNAAATRAAATVVTCSDPRVRTRAPNSDTHGAYTRMGGSLPWRCASRPCGRPGSRAPCRCSSPSWPRPSLVRPIFSPTRTPTCTHTHTHTYIFM